MRYSPEQVAQAMKALGWVEEHILNVVDIRGMADQPMSAPELKKVLTYLTFDPKDIAAIMDKLGGGKKAQSDMEKVLESSSVEGWIWPESENTWGCAVFEIGKGPHGQRLGHGYGFSRKEVLDKVSDLAAHFKDRQAQGRKAQSAFQVGDRLTHPELGEFEVTNISHHEKGPLLHIKGLPSGLPVISLPERGVESNGWSKVKGKKQAQSSGWEEVDEFRWQKTFPQGLGKVHTRVEGVQGTWEAYRRFGPGGAYEFLGDFDTTQEAKRAVDTSFEGKQAQFSARKTERQMKQAQRYPREIVKYFTPEEMPSAKRLDGPVERLLDKTPGAAFSKFVIEGEPWGVVHVGSLTKTAFQDFLKSEGYSWDDKEGKQAQTGWRVGDTLENEMGERCQIASKEPGRYFYLTGECFPSGDLTATQDSLEQAGWFKVKGKKSMKNATQKTAVDSTTKAYFEHYFMAYGAQLTRDLALKKSAKKTAQRTLAVYVVKREVKSILPHLIDANDNWAFSWLVGSEVTVETQGGDQFVTGPTGTVAQFSMGEFAELVRAGVLAKTGEKTAQSDMKWEEFDNGPLAGEHASFEGMACYAAESEAGHFFGRVVLQEDGRDPAESGELGSMQEAKDWCMSYLKKKLGSKSAQGGFDWCQSERDCEVYYKELNKQHPDWSNSDIWAFMLNRMARTDSAWGYVEKKLSDSHAGKTAAQALVFVKDVPEFGIHSGDKFSVVPSSDADQVLLYGDIANKSGMDGIPMPKSKLDELGQQGLTLTAKRAQFSESWEQYGQDSFIKRYELEGFPLLRGYVAKRGTGDFKWEVSTPSLHGAFGVLEGGVAEDQEQAEKAADAFAAKEFSFSGKEAQSDRPMMGHGLKQFVVQVKTDEDKKLVMDQIRSEDSRAEFDHEGNPTTFWVLTRFKQDELEGMAGVLHAEPSIGGKFAQKDSLDEPLQDPDTCEHESVTKGYCDVCGQHECLCEETENGICNECGEVKERHAQVVEVPNVWTSIADNIWECDYANGAHGAIEEVGTGPDTVYKTTCILPDGDGFEEDMFELEDAQSFCDGAAGIEKAADGTMLSAQQKAAQAGKLATQKLKAAGSPQVKGWYEESGEAGGTIWVRVLADEHEAVVHQDDDGSWLAFLDGRNVGVFSSKEEAQASFESTQKEAQSDGWTTHGDADYSLAEKGYPNQKVGVVQEGDGGWDFWLVNVGDQYDMHQPNGNKKTEDEAKAACDALAKAGN